MDAVAIALSLLQDSRVEVDLKALGRSYLEPYVYKSVKPIISVIENIAEEFHGKPIAPLDVYGGAMKTLHLNGRAGMTLIALSGLDMAIWDARARAALSA